MVDLDAGRHTNAVAAYKRVFPKLGSILVSSCSPP
jgi:hypothetical protein